MNPLALSGEKRIINNAHAKNNSSPFKLLLLFFFLLQAFLVKAQSPTITALSSNICAGGSITITGTNFIGITASNVTIGGTAVSSISSFTGTQIIAVVNAASSGKVKVTTSHGTATSSGKFTCYAIPTAPVVTTPINYCLNAVASQLTATGSNLTWGGGTISGTAGGSSVLTSLTYVSNPYSNKETDFTTTAANVEITTVDYYIPAWQSVSGLQLALYNSSGTVIATSGTITTLTNGSTAATISNTFNYTIAAAGNYSIGITAGTGTIGGDSPAFPITEPTGTINVTGTNSLGSAPYHCFNNIQFTVNGSSSTAPTPSTSSTGTTNYLVSQTVNGCVSPEATIAVIVNAAPSATISYSGSPFCKSVGSAQAVTRTGTSGGTYSASPSGLSINASTGAITPSSSTAGTYTVTYTMAAAGGCSAQTATTSVTITAIPSATISYSGSPFCINSGSVSVTQTGTPGGTYSSTSGLSINASTGAINLTASSAGTYTVTYTIAAAGGCAIYTTTNNITITPSAGTPVFALGSTSTRCQGAGSVTYNATASNSTAITYSLDAASISAGNSINSSTGSVSYSATWNGTSTITASAAGCNGPATSTHTATTVTIPSVSATTTYTCVGGSSGTILASGSGGQTPYTYNLNGGTYQTSTLFTGLAAGTYTLGIKSNTGCTSSVTVTVSPYPNSTDDQTATGTNSWIGHMYSGMNFQNYIGHFTEAETFDEGFGGDYNCFTVSSGATYPSIYTEQFSVRFRMNSTRKGLYAIDLGSDDGSRLYVDGTLVYNNWVDQSFSTRPSVLMNLTGSSSLIYEFYENAINNRVIFNNLQLILTDSLTTNTTQTICKGSAGSAISGDTFGTLPSGISLSGTGYQWTYSTTPTGARTDISGATSATYTPNTSIAPFNVAGTYYIYRDAIVSSSNNTGESPYVATNESNAATITVNAPPSATISYSGSPFCTNSGSVSVTQTGTSGGTYSSTSGLSINASTGAINLTASSAGTYTVTYTIAAAGGCAIYTTTNNITITPSAGTPVFDLGSTSTRCQGAGSVTYNATASNSTAITYSLDAASISAGNSINSSTGSVSYSATWNGTSTITASAAGCNGPATSTHTATTVTIPSVSATTTYTCVGGSSGTILASGSGGQTPYTYNLNGGTYQTSTLFTGLAAGTYTLGIKSNTGCTSSVTVTVSPYPNSTDDQTATGTNSWIGHMYSGMNFQNYIGHFTEAETFDEGFGGDYNCFTVSSGATYPSIYTEQFSVRFKMNSTRKGLYAIDLGSDDGSRLYVDGTLVYNNWVDQSFSTRPSVLMNLTGSSSLIYEFYENAISNRVIFNNLQLILTNSLTTNTTQTICKGSAGSAISGDTFGTLPSGISLSGTGYQWTYSTTPTGARTDISGATSATYTPNTSIAPFNVAGTYYIYRDAIVSSSNNTGESPYVATNESNAATLTVNALSVGGTVGTNIKVCTGTNSGTVYLTGQTGNILKWQYSTDGGTSWTDITNVTDSESYSNLTQTTMGRAIVQSGVCPSENSSPVTITVAGPGSWTGSVSDDWNDSRNWLCGQIPTSAINVTIPGGASFYPAITSGINPANNITIESGGSLTISGGTLQIYGSISNSGTLDATNGTVEMKGASAQTLDGSMFSQRTLNNLIVSNTGTGLSVSSAAGDTLKITGSLTFGNSGSTLNTGDNITLVSNSAGTASLGIVGAGNTINGQVVVERYINIGTAAGQHAKSWEFLATPTTGQTVKQSWMESGITTSTGYGTQVTGPGGTAAGFDMSSPSPSLKYYVPSSNSWAGIANTATPVYNANGYFIFIRGDRSVTSSSQSPNNTILRTKGTLLTGTQTPVSVTPDEYGSVGNPYPSPVDFTLITKGAGIDDKFYVWDPNLYGSYGYGGYQTLSSANGWKPVPGGTSAYPSATPYYILQSGQAIFVHATSISPYNAADYNLTFSENNKSNSSSTNVSRINGSAPTADHESLNVSLYTGNTMADGNTVVFDRSFSDAIDGNDALKILNQGENFGLLRNGKLLAIEARAPAAATDTLFYNMSNVSIKSYQLRFAPENMESSGLQAYLIDKFLNTTTPISLSDSSFVNISVTSNSASYASNRFEVVFKALTVMPVTFTSISAAQKNSNILVQWDVENESGIQQYEVEQSADGSQFTQVATVAVNTNGQGSYSWLDENVSSGYHYYRVRSVGKDGQIQYTNIVKVLIGNQDASVSIYPNPIINGDIHIQLNHQPTGVYGIRLLNSLGQVMISKVINHINASSNEELSPGNQLPKGIYQVEITKPDGNIEVINVVN